MADFGTIAGGGGEDWNIACEGFMEIDKTTSTVIIKEKNHG